MQKATYRRLCPGRTSLVRKAEKDKKSFERRVWGVAKGNTKYISQLKKKLKFTITKCVLGYTQHALLTGFVYAFSALIGSLIIPPYPVLPPPPVFSFWGAYSRKCAVFFSKT